MTTGYTRMASATTGSGKRQGIISEEWTKVYQSAFPILDSAAQDKAHDDACAAYGSKHVRDALLCAHRRLSLKCDICSHLNNERFKFYAIFVRLDVFRKVQGLGP